MMVSSEACDEDPEERLVSSVGRFVLVIYSIYFQCF